MRERETIEQDVAGFGGRLENAQLEVLLDIRELLEAIKETVRDGAVEVWSQPE